jgi:hypothetical protein
MPTLPFSTSRFWVTPVLAILSATCLAQAPNPEPVSDQETELVLAQREMEKRRSPLV